MPAEIVQLVDANEVVVTVGGIRKTVSSALIENPSVGEFVLIHVGLCLAKIDREEAERTLALFSELASDGENA
jgi:hydrogenase expression/formation protein HypC